MRAERRHRIAQHHIAEWPACAAETCRCDRTAVPRMASQHNHQTLTSGSSFTERTRPKRNDSFSETPVKTRPEGSLRLLTTPLSARQHRPASRGLTSQSSRVPVETPLVRESLAAAFFAKVSLQPHKYSVCWLSNVSTLCSF